MTRFNLLALSTASLLVLAGCNSPSDPTPPSTPIPPAPAPAAVVTADGVVPVNEPALRAETLGTLNGCRIDRVVVDGKSFVMASAVFSDTVGSSAAYAAASCDLEPTS